MAEFKTKKTLFQRRSSYVSPKLSIFITNYYVLHDTVYAGIFGNLLSICSIVKGTEILLIDLYENTASYQHILNLELPGSWIFSLRSVSTLDVTMKDVEVLKALWL